MIKINPQIVFLIAAMQLFVFVRLQAQVLPIEANFRSPLDIPLYVAGNFGEVRSNHFHTGMDFKTMGVEGKNIYAIEDGYISRIAFSHYGYGRALYITHPNGYTSVYAHLSKFKSPIAEYAKNYQYSVQEETYNVYLDSGELVVKKGQIVALGGNSGSSSAPHLHFEIRETDTENPMNPLLFGYKITDSKKPMINNLKIYPLDDQALINGVGVRKVIPVKKNKKGNYYINQEIRAHGNIGFALHSTDRLNARNICGLYTLDLTVNGSDLFSHRMDKLDFSTNRYVNHHVDYLRHKRNNQTFHKSFMKGNNLLDIYNYVGNGYLYVENDSIYSLKYKAKDFAGNISSLVFNVKGYESKKVIPNYVTLTCTKEFKHDESNYFDTTGFKFLMAEYTLYDDLCFFYNREKDSTYFSDVHDMVTKYAPVHHYYKISIAPNKEIDSLLQSKLVIVKIDDKGKMSDRGGDFQEGFVTTRVREFGRFAIAIDTTKPVVKPLTETFKLSKTSSISFKIEDNLSGIQSYSARIDGEWILASYKRKKDKLIVYLSEVENITSGFHQLEVGVTDERGNVSLRKIKIEVN